MRLFVTIFINVLLVVCAAAQWTQTPNLTAGGSMNSITKAIISINGKVLVGGESTFGPFLCASTNSGASWTTSYTGIGAPVISIASSGNRLLASTATTMHASTDTGKTWTNSSTGLATSTGAYAIVANGATVFAGTTKGTYISTNNGQAWTRQDSVKWFSSLGVLGTTLYGATGDLGKMHSSTNNGLTWSPVDIGITDYNISQISVVNNTLYCATSWAGIRVSTNGTIWTKITPDSMNNIYSIYINGTTIYAGSDDGRVWVSNNSGSNWKNFSGDIPSGNVIRGFANSGTYALVAVRQNRVWRRLLSELTSVPNTGIVQPSGFSLLQNYPNPFNPTTKIQFTIPVSGNAMLTVYDVIGKEVATLVNEHLTAGTYESTFDAPLLSSGLYFYTLRVNALVETKKMMLMR